MVVSSTSNQNTEICQKSVSCRLSRSEHCNRICVNEVIQSNQVFKLKTSQSEGTLIEAA